MIHNASNSMDTAVTSSTNSMHCLNTIVSSPPLPASASAVQTVGGPTVGSVIAPATVVNNNNNNTNANILIDEIASENYWLREKVKEINADRDRLLCEVANLRLELDMAELKRLPEDRWVTLHKVFFFFTFTFPLHQFFRTQNEHTEWLKQIDHLLCSTFRFWFFLLLLLVFSFKKKIPNKTHLFWFDKKKKCYSFATANDTNKCESFILKS